jgi:signal transduction histidine kinase
MSSPAPSATGLLARVGRLEAWLHVTVVLLTLASAVRYLQGHGLGDAAPWVLAGAACLLVVYASRRRVAWRDRRWWPPVWFALLSGTWFALVVTAPSFSWCAVPLAFVALRELPFGVACGVVAAMVVTVALAWSGMRQVVDPTVLVGPACVAVLAVVAYRALDADARLRQRLLDDLREAQNELADSQHRSGRLAERARLSREIHDSVAQGLSSINLLLQAAEQDWDRRPDAARGLVGQAAQTARDGLDETRRLVRDLAPAELHDADALPAALAQIAREAERPGGLEVELRIHGDRVPVPLESATALLRTARGALANVVEHAAAGQATLTLTFHDSSVSLDVRDDGHGFAPEAASATGDGVRGLGLPGLRSRMLALGGRLVVESAPGEGTVVAASLPLHAAGP